MSASLVGSEMCIRDRRREGRGRTAHWGCWGRQARQHPQGQPPRRRPLPVSYTHLTLPTICSV
eukprot:11914290-Alexandrium_andersonii.AAC.1